MIEIMCLALFATCAIGAAFMSNGSVAHFKAFLRWLVWTIALLMAFLLVTGLFRSPDSALAFLHQLLGHLVEFVVALGAGTATGVLARHQFLRRPFRSLGWFLLYLLLLACCLSNGRTGYFGASHLVDPPSPENELRFIVLHRVFMPGLAGLILAVWLRRLERAALEPSAIQKPQAEPTL